MKNYSVYESGRLPIKNQTISADLFLSSVDSGHTRGHNVLTINAGDNFDVLSYDTTHSGWETFWASFWGSGLSEGDDYYDNDPIYALSAADLIGTDAQISTNLMVNVDDVKPLKEMYLQTVIEGKKVYLMRFSVTDYYNKLLRVSENKFLGASDNDSTFYSTETVFFDFDIIQLTLYKNGKYIELPVVADPVDIIGDIENIITDSETWLEDLKKILAIVLGLFLVVVLIAVFGPILPGIIKFVWFIVTLPIRILGGFFKAIGRAARAKRE